MAQAPQEQRRENPERRPRSRAESEKSEKRSKWGNTLRQVKNEQKEDNLSFVAAGVAFYTLLAIFPALATTVSIYGIVADPSDVQRLMQPLSQVLPQVAFQLINDQLSSIVSTSGGALGIGAIGGLLLTLWSSAKSIKALSTALNIAYDREEQRGFFKLNGMAFLLTVGAMVFFLVAVSLIVALPAIIGFVGIPQTIQSWVVLLRWPLLAIVVVAGLSVLYRYAPDKEKGPWKRVVTGALIATLLWIGVSWLFSFYVSNFGSYNKTYGSFGAIIILMMWLWLTAYVVLLGGEINAVREREEA